jgi:hypothetical protein
MAGFDGASKPLVALLVGHNLQSMRSESIFKLAVAVSIVTAAHGCAQEPPCNCPNALEGPGWCATTGPAPCSCSTSVPCKGWCMVNGLQPAVVPCDGGAEE